MDPMFGVHLAPFGDVLPLVQMEYLWEKLTSSVKWRIIPVAVRKLQMTLGNYFFPRVICRLCQLCHFPFVSFVVNYSIWTRGWRHQKVPNEPQTLDPFTEWLNFMFKYTNINFKNGTLLLWNLWLVCGKMINGSLESAFCKTPHIIKHSERYSNFHPIVI